MKRATRLAHAGRQPSAHYGMVNTPVYHASTVLFDSLAAFDAASVDPFSGVHYGRLGTPTHFAFEAAIAELEGAHGTVSTCSGLAAIAIAILAVTQAGAHVLVADNVYGPTRKLCDGLLARHGVRCEYFDPLSTPAALAERFTEQTCALFVEAPGSLTFEIADVPALAECAHQHGVTVIADNTWGTPVYFDALGHGVDLSVHAATKYIVGHSDAMLGTVSAVDEARYRAVRETAIALGYCAGPDDVYLGARGLRTLGQRLPVHEANGLALANWLAEQPGVARVFHPARADHPQHDRWLRDFSGACGLFAIELAPISRECLAALIDGLSFYGLGASWGGYESLVLPVDPTHSRSAVAWQADGPLLRIHAGLEDIDDLIDDMAAGLARAGLA
ncbi:cystathionine beta-lyase [Salinisphaera sp. Q1T1-3]|uniref:cystathionine beta-lyase n=1 Tax=Salinisphaera sp. Q1T1-3 TaxID=2321229 RepID=UPI000E758CFB|nr:cystathionine beta-lyase [Salinisphaera sp. Q1T1-3]RJS93829.1 cystathionine beta-lyase [Salinisphaera sp. Q1T1-3]